MTKLKIVILVVGVVVAAIVIPRFIPGIRAVAAAPVTQTIQDLVAVGALLFVIVGLPLMNFLRGRR